MSLPEIQQQILAFERQNWRFAGSKEHAIRQRFGVSAARYFQQLNAVLDSPAAMAHDPMMVRRLRRLRSSRRALRRGAGVRRSS